jgi:hypothetical protein
MKEALNNEQPEPLIFTIRDQRVVLDADLARLYGIETFRFNQAFKRNRHRFPADFAFQLTANEFDNLRSQIATSSRQAFDSQGLNSSQFAMSSMRRRGKAYSPWALPSTGRSWRRTSCAANEQCR